MCSADGEPVESLIFWKNLTEKARVDRVMMGLITHSGHMGQPSGRLPSREGDPLGQSNCVHHETIY